MMPRRQSMSPRSRAVYYPADFEQVGVHHVEGYVIAEHAEAHAGAEFGAQPRGLREGQQMLTVPAQFADE